MNTAEINTSRLETIRGPVATELVAVARNRLRRRPRVIAIGTGTGRGFVITTGGIATTHAPVDFVEAVAEVDSKPVQAWSSAVHDDIDNEQVGAEIATQPWLY
jgi:hypothetical protein